MTRSVLSPRAQDDVDQIWDYTVALWGVAQAKRYVDNIRGAIERVAADPRRGRPCPEIKAGYARCDVGSHVVFYRTRADGIEVVRILHRRMDFRRHV